MQIDDLKKTIRQVPDFPKAGINFYDVSTLFRNAEAFRFAVEQMASRYEAAPPDALAGIEARGFVLASAMAFRLRRGLVLIRKFGKLPGDIDDETYDLEYGQARIEMQRDAVRRGQNVLIVDDLLATGGTAAAAGRLVQRIGARVAGYAFMVELGFLGGRRKLDKAGIFSLLHYGRATGL